MESILIQTPYVTAKKVQSINFHRCSVDVSVNGTRVITNPDDIHDVTHITYAMKYLIYTH